MKASTTTKVPAIPGLAPKVEIEQEIYIDGTKVDKGFVITPEWADANAEIIQQYLDLFISYPDLYIDLITPQASTFRLFFYQRIFLRASMRFRYMFGTFTRAYSKSFLAILSRVLQCIFLPNTKTFVCADIKSSGIKITNEKIEEIFNLWPMLQNEVLVKHKGGDDYIEVIFRNGSMFDAIGVTQGTRGIRRTSGIFEEAAMFDGDEVNERVLPTLNISRKDVLGRMYQDEPTQSQCWITSAGGKTCFAYEKLIEIAVMSIINPKTAFVCGGDYRLPVKVGLLNKSYIEDMRLSPTFKEDSFAREMMSIWTGGSSESWLDMDRVARYRKYLRVERAAENGKLTNGDFYIISVDVGRLSANTIIHVFRVHPKENYYQKYLVYTETLYDTHFNDQAVRIKELNNLYMPKEIVVDGNGLGIGLVDQLIMTNTDPKTGADYAPIGVSNDEEYLKRQDPTAAKVLFVLKTNASDAGLIHSNCYVQLSSGRVTFLAQERLVRNKLMATKRGQKMNLLQRKQFLMPYEMTSRLFDELANLKIKPKPNGFDVEQITRRIHKDRFSALEYGLWRIKYYEDSWTKERNKKSKKMTDYVMFTPKTGVKSRNRR